LADFMPLLEPLTKADILDNAASLFERGFSIIETKWWRLVETAVVVPFRSMSLGDWSSGIAPRHENVDRWTVVNRDRIAGADGSLAPLSRRGSLV
jgi:hypothetical protein